VPLNFSITNKILFECFRLLVSLTFRRIGAVAKIQQRGKLSRAANAKSAVKNLLKYAMSFGPLTAQTQNNYNNKNNNKYCTAFICTSILPSTMAASGQQLFMAIPIPIAIPPLHFVNCTALQWRSCNPRPNPKPKDFLVPSSFPVQVASHKSLDKCYLQLFYFWMSF